MTRRKLTCDASINPLQYRPTSINIDPLQYRPTANTCKLAKTVLFCWDAAGTRRRAAAEAAEAGGAAEGEAQEAARAARAAAGRGQGARFRERRVLQADLASEERLRCVILSETDAMVCGIPPEC